MVAGKPEVADEEQAADHFAAGLLIDVRQLHTKAHHKTKKATAMSAGQIREARRFQKSQTLNVLACRRLTMIAVIKKPEITKKMSTPI